MPNIVLDANALVSAFVARSRISTSRRALGIARARFTICLSDAIEAELRQVLLRPKVSRYGATPPSAKRRDVSNPLRSGAAGFWAREERGRRVDATGGSEQQPAGAGEKRVTRT